MAVTGSPEMIIRRNLKKQLQNYYQIPFLSVLVKLRKKGTLKECQEGQLSVTGESMCTKYWLTA